MTLRIEPGSEPIPGYTLVERLGGGGFGEVWKAVAPGGLHKAIKVVYGDLNTTDADGTKRTEQELKAMKRVQTVRHPYLLSLERYDIIDARLLIVMELADRNLWDRFKEAKSQGHPGIPRDELVRYMEEAAEVLDLMNVEYQLQHLDIKPQNLFLVRNHVKVADFGLVKDLEGMMATVTGGITPVYAAPETFDGKVSRFCDQYSLAIVYQELLTGVRPFSGTSLQQLIMQHLSAQPNLIPLPKSDRGPIGRALHKKAESRFPSCAELVQALRQGAEAAARAAAAPVLPEPVEAPEPAEPPPIPAAPAAEPGSEVHTPALRRPPVSKPPVEVRTPPPPVAQTRAVPPAGQRPGRPKPDPNVPVKILEDLPPPPPEPARPAVRRTTGEGTLFPALVIGLGQKGAEVLHTLREGLDARFGSMNDVPHIRLLYIDTDGDAVSAAARAAAGPLSVTETLPIRVNRPSHYLRATGGKTMLDGWFNSKLIYRIPRTPATTGLRCLGRLAFVDHYKSIAAKVRADLEACAHASALQASDRRTKLGIRTNWPRVYVVTGLTGGSGSGMFLDVAYLARSQLKHLGYTEPDVVSLLFLPQLDLQRGNTLALGNAVAALKELAYYSAPQTTFAFKYDDKEKVKDSAPPFNRSILLPLEPEAERGRAGEATRQAGDYLLRDLMTTLGRAADDSRGGPDPSAASKAEFETVGLQRFTWPRRYFVQRCARQICTQLVQERWLAKDAGILREPIHKWLTGELTRLELDAENLIGQLQEACEKELKQSPEQAFAELIEPFVAQNQRNFELDPDGVRDALDQLAQLVGSPEPDQPGQRQAVMLGDIMDKAGDGLARKWSSRMAALALSLVEKPNYRLRGAEEAVRQLVEVVTEIMESHEPVLQDLEQDANDNYARIHDSLDMIEANPGGGRRIANMIAELGEALRAYPRSRYQALILRRVANIFTTIRGKLSDQIREVGYVRQRLTELTRALEVPVPPPPDDARAGCVQLTPAGYRDLEEAVEGLLETIGEEELRELDLKAQEMIRQQFQSLMQACLNSANVVRSLEEALMKLAEDLVATRLTDANVVEMFLTQFEDDESGLHEIARAFNAAAPALAHKVVCADPESRVLALPAGPATDQFRELVRRALPKIPLVIIDSPDDIVVFREQPGLPLDRLELLGPGGKQTYEQVTGSDNFTPHSREDVTDWTVPE